MVSLALSLPDSARATQSQVHGVSQPGHDVPRCLAALAKVPVHSSTNTSLRHRGSDLTLSVELAVRQVYLR